MTTQISSNNDLLAFLLSRANSGVKNWFGFSEQRITGINLAYDIARNHADTMTPEEVVAYVVKLNNTIHSKIIKGE